MNNHIEQFSLQSQLNKPAMNNNKHELEALNNCLNYYNLTGYKIHEYFQQDKRRTKQMYFLTDEKGVSLTGHWEYLELNHWIGGYGKAFNKFTTLTLLEAAKIVVETDRKIQSTFPSEIMDALSEAIKQAEQ